MAESERDRRSRSEKRLGIALIAGMLVGQLVSAIAVVAPVLVAFVLSSHVESASVRLTAIMVAGAMGTTVAVLAGAALGNRREYPWTFAAGAAVFSVFTAVRVLPTLVDGDVTAPVLIGTLVVGSLGLPVGYLWSHGLRRAAVRVPEPPFWLVGAALVVAAESLISARVLPGIGFLPGLALANVSLTALVVLMLVPNSGASAFLRFLGGLLLGAFGIGFCATIGVGFDLMTEGDRSGLAMFLLGPPGSFVLPGLVTLIYGIVVRHRLASVPQRDRRMRT